MTTLDPAAIMDPVRGYLPDTLEYRLAEALARVTVVLDEAYREDAGLTTWSQHPELELPQRYEAWLDEEERQGR